MRSHAVTNRVDVFRRGPKAMYRKRETQKNGDQKENDVSEVDTVQTASVVNLRSTLELFGSASFKLESYLERRIGHNKNEQAHKQELANRKALLSGALKTFVTDHYQMFIHTSQEIENIEADLSNLHTALSQYKVSLKKLQDAHSCDDMSSDTEQSSTNNGVLNKNQQPYTGFINELAEELNMLRYERKLDQATAVLESAYKKLEHETDDVAAAKELLNAEKEKIIDLSTELFQNQSLKLSERRRYLTYMIRFGSQDKALTLLFEERSSEMRTAQSQNRSTGDLISLITDISGTVFSSIGKAWVEFKRIFRDPSRDSYFFTWAFNELNVYCNTVRYQVFRPDTPFRTACQCIHLAILACKVLEKQGIKLSYVLDRFFIDDLRSALRLFLSNARQTISKTVRTENWVIEQAWIRQANSAELAEKGSDKLDITKSARIFYDIIHQYIIDMKLVVLNPGLFDPTVSDLVPIAVNGLRSLFEEYLVQMATASKTPELTESQGVAMVGNARCLAEDLYPRLLKQLGNRLRKQRGLEDVLAFQEQLTKFYKAQRDYFSQRQIEIAAPVSSIPVSSSQ